MRKLLAALALLGLSLPLLAAPPYSVSATVSAPPSGGSVASYELFLDGVLVGPVVVGANSFPNLLTADGTYNFRVDAINSIGRTASDPVVVVVLPPGKPGLTIVVTQ